MITLYQFFHHRLKTQICKRGQKGVAIILSPDLAKMCKVSGCLTPIIPNSENNIEYGKVHCD